MKKATLFILILFTVGAHSQNYVLDPAFGDSGTSVKFTNFYPKDVLLYNGHYYLISDSKVYKMQYNGSTDTSFGNNGLVSLSNPGSVATTHSISGFKISNGYIYVYGTTNADNDIQKDGFLAKFDTETGTLDATFGTNGISYIDFAGNESINDIVLETGGFYCTGTRSDVLIYFKLTTNGSLVTSFDAAGYKQILLHQKSYATAIKPYNGNFLLIGKDYDYSGSTVYNKLLLAMVDAEGNLITSYGNNGTLSVELGNGYGITVLKVEIAGDMLYADFHYSWSYYDNGGKTLKYNLNTSTTTTLYNSYTNHYPFSKPDGDKLYRTGSYFCPSSYSCDRNFTLQRFNSDGTADATFMNGAEYDYSFPSENISDDVVDILVKGDDGTLLIAGTTGFGQNAKLAALRIKDSALNTDTFTLQNNISPNPFTDHITLNTAQKPLSAEIYDLTGRLVAKPMVNYTGGSINLNLANITQSGMYLLTLNFVDKVVKHKIIKE